MNYQASAKAEQHSCAVCGAPAAVWCHHDEASLCSWCDTEVHSKGPLAWTHKRTPLPTAKSGDEGVMLQADACQGPLRRFDSRPSREQVCVHQSFALPEAGSTEDAIFDADGLEDFDWVPPEIDAPAIDTAELNALSMEADFDILDDPFVQPLQSGAVKPPASFTPTAAAAPPMAAASLSKSGPDVISCPIPTDESDNLDGIIWPPPPSPPGRPHATQPPPTQTASRDTSSSGPALVPTPSCQSFDQYARPAASEDPPAPPPAGAAGAAQPTSSSSAVVMPMPVQMPMQPFAPWQFMDMFLPMQHMCQPWLAYIPASLTPKGDDAVHKEALAARRAKRDRFQQKKRELSCRKTVRYASRKRYADSRPRVNGRFISKAATAAAVAAATAVTVSDESA